MTYHSSHRRDSIYLLLYGWMEDALMNLILESHGDGESTSCSEVANKFGQQLMKGTQALNLSQYQ